MNRLTYTTLLAVVFLTACATFYDSTVTTTAVVKVAMTNWSDLSASGNTTPEIDAKIIAAHRAYQQSAVIARDALVSYKNGGDQATYQKAFEAARAGMNAVLDLVVPLLQPAQKVDLQSKMGRATRL